MKKRIIAFLLCFALVMPILPAFAVTTEDITLSATSVTLPQYEKKTITAAPGANVQVSAYQWQIKVPGTDLWVDISGAKGATLELSYAMVASLLQGDQAQIRCEAVIGGETVETEVVTVTMDYTSEPAVVTESEPVQPQVLKQATVVESSVSAPASNAKQEETVEDDSDLAALEEARNAAITAEGEAEAAVAAAQEKLTAAQNAEAAAKAALDQAQADYDAAVAAAVPAETEAEDAETTEAAPAVTVDPTARDAAEAAYADAQNATAAAQKELDEANAALTAAQAKTADAQKAYEAAEAKTATTAMAAFSTTRRTSSAVMMADAEVNATHIITIQYLLAGTTKEVADPYLAEAMAGKPLNETVISPTVVGYTPQHATYEINIENVTGPVTYTVYYDPSNVGFTVEHYKQNLDMATYALAETVKHDGYTGSTVGDVHKTYEGFTYLLYERPTVAADGKTVVEVKYDRKYVLVNFDLGGGYGVEPIYAPYGSNIGNVGTPSLPGNTFAGWSLDGSSIVDLPSTVPPENVTYKAIWSPDATAKVSAVIWGENANDEEYSYIKTSEFYAKPGETINYTTGNITDPNMDSSLWTYVRSDTVTVKADGSTVMNVYYDRTTFTLTFRAGGKNVATISDKWGASISDEFQKAPFNTTYNGRAWKCTETKKYGYALQTLDIMPEFNATFNLYDKSSNTLKTIYYYLENVGANVSHNTWPTSTANFTLLKEVDTYFNFATYEEEYHEIEGFTRYSKTVSGFGNDEEKDFRRNELYLYYLRNSYSLDFNNGYEKTKSETVEYQAKLDSFNDYIPPFPTELYEEGSRVFDGWYLNPECTGAEFVLSEETMPKSNLILYAKWTPVTHEVKIFLTEDDAKNLSNQLGETQTVDHRATAKQPDKSEVVNPESADYEFVGWFYKENGEEKAFDFSMGVTKDLVLYAKWSSNVEKEFTIYYKLEGTTTDVADPTTGKGLVDNSKTFDAKVGEELYEDYQEGFFPHILSHTINLSITDANNSGENTFTFWYKETTVPYTVKYLDKVTGKEVAPTKFVEKNKKSYVTETFVQVPGLLPDAYQKSLALQAGTTAEKNVIIFYYAEDATRAYYAHTHWFMNDTGEWERRSSDQDIGNIGAEIAHKPLENQDGYTYDQSLTKVIVGETESAYTGPVELTAAGLEIRHYYVEDKVDLKYVAVGPEGATGFGSVNPETEKVAIFTGLATGSTATATENYEFVGWYDNAACEGEAISLEAKYVPTRPADGWVDESTFYAKFEEKEVTINYVVIGPEGCGTVTPASETVKVLTGTAAGSTAAATSNDYKFVGWYSDENCTHQLSEDAKYIPAKIDGKNIATTYYAKFDYNLTTMTITKSLINGAYDPQDTFIFDVSGSDGSKFVVTLSPADGRSSVTIGNVTVGVTYTVTERAGGGSNRYTATETPDAKALVPNGKENVFAFTNKLTNNKWLTASDVKHNVFN